MRILVAGATGAVGRNLLPRLVASGHQVVGTTRTEAKSPLIRQLGGEASLVSQIAAEVVGLPKSSARCCHRRSRRACGMAVRLGGSARANDARAGGLASSRGA
jgi:nucleoside-diphosphate-sugar epimerase